MVSLLDIFFASIDKSDNNLYSLNSVSCKKLIAKSDIMHKMRRKEIFRGVCFKMVPDR